MRLFLFLFLAGCATQLPPENDASVDLNGSDSQNDAMPGLCGGIGENGFENLGSGAGIGGAIRLDRSDADIPMSIYDGSTYRTCSAQLIPIMLDGQLCLENVCIGDCPHCVDGILVCWTDIGDPPPI